MTRRNLLLALFACTICLLSFAPQKKVKQPEKKFGWHLGAQAYTFRLFTFAEALDKIDSAGLTYVEAFPGQTVGAGSTEKLNYTLSPEGKKLVKDLLKKKKITLHAFGVTGAKDAEEWEKVFQFAQEMGIKVINSEPQENQLQLVSDLCDKYKIKVALHNHPEPSFYWNPDKVLSLLEGKSEYLGVCADVGHWARSGLDPVVSLQKLQGKIFHLHFKDLNEFGKKNAHDVHWGTGIIGMDKIIAELKRQKFKGMLSAEYEYNWENNMNDVKISAENFRKAL